MTSHDTVTSPALDGGCTCGAVRYRIACAPIFVHCCHCHWCQRETGSAFAVNAMIESDRVGLLQGETETVTLPSESGNGQRATGNGQRAAVSGQRVACCPTCHIALWSHYHGAGDEIRFIRVGTLDDPDALPPEIHVHASSKQPWVVLPENVRAFVAFYDPKLEWTDDALQRFGEAKAKAV